MTTPAVRKTMMVSEHAHEVLSESARKHKLSTVAVCDTLLGMVDLAAFNAKLAAVRQVKRDSQQDRTKKRAQAKLLADTLSLTEIKQLADPEVLQRLRSLLNKKTGT